MSCTQFNHLPADVREAHVKALIARREEGTVPKTPQEWHDAFVTSRGKRRYNRSNNHGFFNSILFLWYDITGH